MATKGDNKEHIKTADGREPIIDGDGRMDFTKSGKAYQIFDEMHKEDENASRKDCVERAVKEAGMTNASAATFYQKWRSDRGLVHRAEDGDDGGNTAGGNNKPGHKGNTAGKK